MLTVPAGQPLAEEVSPGFVLEPGRLLDGRYLIQAFIGRGGMGAVYRGHDQQTDQPVAIKTILPAAGVDQARRFRREFRALIQLSHPHVIAVRDYGQLGSMPYYVMEYVQGPDLYQLLYRRGGALSVPETIVIGLQLGQALAYIHNQGIIHRDIKPSNIMVMENGRAMESASDLYVKLMDFGLVKIADVSAQLTASGAMIGTLKYLAPEQMKGLNVDRRADLYSLGLVLYETVTGGFPFSGTTALDLAFQRLTQPPRHPAEFRADVPRPLTDLLLKLLAADLNERYGSAEELLADLAPLGEVSVAPVPSVPPRADIIARSPLVGREAELARLHDLLQLAWGGPGRFVLVEGEAGVGKTRLLQELIALARQAGGRCLQASCYEEERIAYGPFVQVLESLITGHEGRHRAFFQGLEAELGRLVPSLGVTVVSSQALGPEEARLRLFDAVTRLFVRLGQDRPLVLVVDDLQWVDEASLELLHYLVRNTMDAPVFICGTARYEELSEDHPLSLLLQGMSRRGLVDRLLLERLSSSAVADLVAALLVGGEAPSHLADRLYHEAEGNPFFVEEMLKAWVEEGRLVWEEGGWQMVTPSTAARASAPTMPGSIADIVSRRLRGVPEVEMELLVRAAVLGREFNFDVLLQMAGPEEEESLLDAIEDLLRARLLEEVDHPYEDRYCFAHNKIPEVLYARQSRPRLRRAHRDAGEAMEQVYAGRLEGVIEPLARHFLEAGDRRGLGYGLQAGSAARALYANKEALDYYGRALSLAEKVGQSETDSLLAQQVLTLCSAMAEVSLLVGDYSTAIERFRVALDRIPQARLEDSQRREMMASTRRRLAYAYEEQGYYDDAMAELQSALETLPETEGTSRELALILKSIAWVKRRQGDYRAAVARCHEGLRAVPPDDYGAVADLCDTLGEIHMALGEYGPAAGYHQRSLDLRQELNDQPGVAKAYNNLAVISDLEGQEQQAIDYYQRSLAISKKIGHATGLASLYNNLGLIYGERGDYDQAIQHYEEALAIFERIGNNLGVALAYGNLGEAYQGQGDLARAADYLQSALDRSSEIGDPEGVTYAHHLLAEIHLRRGDPQLAMESGRQALEVADAIGARRYQAKANAVLGRTLLALGQPDRALTFLETAHRLLSELGDQEEAAAVQAVLGQAAKEEEEGAQ